MKKSLCVWCVLVCSALVGCRARPPTVSDPDRGRFLYDEHCAGCHGAKGDGQGPVAKFLWPKPRDFTAGIFKYRTTHGAIPDDTDLLQTMKVGIPGTAMPGWDMLNSQDWRAILAYVKRFIPRLAQGKAGARIDVPTVVPSSPEAVAAGRKVFESGGCIACHGPEGRGDGPSAGGLRDAWGDLIAPRDLTHGPLKWGNDVKELYRTLASGVPGTPMPGYERTLTSAQLWHLVYYLQSIQRMPADYQPSNPKRFLIHVAKVEGALPLDGTDPRWARGVPVPVYLHELWANNTSAEWVTVRALHNGSEIAFQLRWADDQADQRPQASDAVAIQFPVHAVDDPAGLPYVGMGSAANPVRIWEWKPAGTRALEGKGMDALTPLPARDAGPAGHGTYAQGEWQVCVKAPLIRATNHYVAFVLWDADLPRPGEPQSFSEWMLYELE